jgi:hypothetical protein
VYTISKSDWLPRALESRDSRGNKIGSLVFSSIRTHLSLDNEFMLPPATNAVVELKSAREMTRFVQAYSRPFVPAAREVLSVKARTGKKIGILLSAVVVFTGMVIAWRIWRSKNHFGFK